MKYLAFTLSATVNVPEKQLKLQFFMWSGFTLSAVVVCCLHIFIYGAFDSGWQVQILGGKHARQSGPHLNHNFSGGRVMRRFTLIAFSMRKVLTHLVFLWRRVCHTITRIAGSWRKAIYWLKCTNIISSQIINAEWSCNLYLQRIIPTPSIPERAAAFDLLGFSNRSTYLGQFTCRRTNMSSGSETRRFLYHFWSAEQKKIHFGVKLNILQWQWLWSFMHTN